MLNGRNEGVDEAVVLGASDARVPPAEIFGVAKTFLVVGADVENDRKRAGGMNAADERIERKFADGNAQAADALIADAENAFAIGDNDDVDFGIWMIAQQSGDEVAQRIGDKEAARTPIDVAEFLAAKSDHWRIDDRKHLVDMIEKQAIEENFVGVLKLAEIDVALEIIRF